LKTVSEHVLGVNLKEVSERVLGVNLKEGSERVLGVNLKEGSKRVLGVELEGIFILHSTVYLNLSIHFHKCVESKIMYYY
jgi:hypothetical protein